MKKKLLTVAMLALVTGSAMQAQTTIFGLASSWRFNDADVALPATWKNANYDVSYITFDIALLLPQRMDRGWGWKRGCR